MENMQVARSRTAVQPLAVSKKFGRYKKEDKKTVRKADVKEGATLKELKKAWRAYKYEEDHHGGYNGIAPLVKSLQYSSDDVERFSLVIAEFQDEEKFSHKAGFFLSALVNNGEDSHYVVHTTHLKKPVDKLGYKNTKNIAVKGDVGMFVGYSMEDGTIMIEGDAGEYAGAHMSGGNIRVKGNVDECVGSSMEGGIITIDGDAGDIVGFCMKDGVIRIEGSLGSVYEFTQMGRIYHKGELIVRWECD